MPIKLNKPILVTGVTLSLGLGLWESLHPNLITLGEWGVIGAIAIGGGLWLLRQGQPKINFSSRLFLTKEKVDEVVAQARRIVKHLETEAPEYDLSQLNQQLAALPQGFERQALQIAIAGRRKVGKTAIKQQLEGQISDENLTFVETKPFLSAVDTEDKKAKTVCLASDAVLYVLDGDLTDCEWQILQELARSYQHLILLFNKQDRYQPEERELVLQQLRERVKTIIPSEEVIAVAAAPKAMKVRQIQADGSVKEWMEELKAQLSGLDNHITQLISQEKAQLLLASVWREATGLKQQGKETLNQIRRDRAVPIIEQYQWIVGATAFANPVAALDLLATAAINGQLLVDLGEVYQQKFSLSQAQEAAGTIGKLMVQLGLVELSTQTIGSILKGNALTYVAGGAIQGISAAYLTRLAGLSLIEYLQEQEVSLATGEGFNLDKLGSKLKQVFEQNQRTAFLQNFVKQAISHLSLEKAPA